MVGDLVGEDLRVATLQGDAEPAPGVPQGLNKLSKSICKMSLGVHKVSVIVHNMSPSVTKK